jgi:hypothetical protein
MDLQAIINEHPEVVLVDELAHTNVEGSKNKKDGRMYWKSLIMDQCDQCHEYSAY